MLSTCYCSKIRLIVLRSVHLIDDSPILIVPRIFKRGENKRISKVKRLLYRKGQSWIKHKQGPPKLIEVYPRPF